MDASQNAKFALVIAASAASYGPDKRKQMAEFASNLQNDAQPPEGTKAIHDNVWLIDLPNGLPFLGSLVKWARPSKIHLRILFLESEPDWIKYPPDEPEKPESA